MSSPPNDAKPEGKAFVNWALEKKIEDPRLLAGVPSIGCFSDRFGNSFYFGNAGSFRMPAFSIGEETSYMDHVRGIRNLEMNDDDILICSFPKSGLHWHREIITRLLSRTAEMKPGVVNLLDRAPLQQAIHLQRPRLLATHVPFRYVPRQALQKKIKIIYLRRNPKDILVSYYTQMHSQKLPLHYPGSFEQMVRLYLECGHHYGDPIEYAREHHEGFREHSDIQVLTSTFEDMKKDPIGGVVKLNTYLGTGCSLELCESIAHACSIEEMKMAKAKSRDQSENISFKEGSAGFYRKGEIGDWKNWFSPTLNQVFDKEIEKRLAGSGIQFQYE